MSTYIVCEDAGAAANLSVVAARLRADGGLAGVVVGAAAAGAFGVEASIVRSEADLTPERWLAPLTADGVLLTGSTPWGMRVEARSVLAARTRGIRIVTYLDYWANYSARLSYPGTVGLELIPDRLAVVDGQMRDDLVAIGVEAERIVVTGAPAFDALWARRGLIQVPPTDARVLFVSQPIEALYGARLGYTEKTILTLIAPIAAKRGLEVVVRPHPREDSEPLERLVATLPGTVRVSADGTLADALARARLVTGMTTMALVEASILGRPTLSIQIGAREVVELPTARVGATVTVTTPAALEDAIDLATHGGPARPPVGEGWTPGATDRLLALL